MSAITVEEAVKFAQSLYSAVSGEKRSQAVSSYQGLLAYLRQPPAGLPEGAIVLDTDGLDPDFVEMLREMIANPTSGAGDPGEKIQGVPTEGDEPTSEE